MSDHPSEFRKSLNDLSRDSIYETMREVLGENVAVAYDRYLQNSLHIPQEETFERLQVIFSSLRDEFGIGSEVLGRRIVRRLYSKTGVSYVEVPGRPIFEDLEILRTRLEESKR